MFQRSGYATVLVLATALLSGCGSDTAEPVAVGSAATTTRTPSPILADPTTAATTSAATPISATMPNVVCMNLQDAQDTIQAVGVFLSRSADASGKGRKQIIDSNWVVVAQKPAPGEPIFEGSPVLSAVKIGEPGDCS